MHTSPTLVTQPQEQIQRWEKLAFVNEWQCQSLKCRNGRRGRKGRIPRMDGYISASLYWEACSLESTNMQENKMQKTTTHKNRLIRIETKVKWTTLGVHVEAPPPLRRPEVLIFFAFRWKIPCSRRRTTLRLSLWAVVCVVSPCLFALNVNTLCHGVLQILLCVWESVVGGSERYLGWEPKIAFLHFFFFRHSSR